MWLSFLKRMNKNKQYITSLEDIPKYMKVSNRELQLDTLTPQIAESIDAYIRFWNLADDEMGIALPKSVTKGKIIKVVQEDGQKRYDFQFVNTRGFKTTVEGLSYKFDREFWNYARLISGVLRYGMPIDQAVKMISGLQMDNDSINSWTTGVARVLKRYIPGAEVENLEETI